MTASDERLRRELHASFKHRALLYRRFFDELRRELGEARATELMRRAIYARGREIGADTWQPGREGCCHLHVRPGGRPSPPRP